MKLSTRNLSKRYGAQWVIKDFNQDFSIGKTYAVTGPNGSGKSTLMKMLTGLLPPSKGEIIYSEADQAIEVDEWSKHIALAAPYMDLLEDLTLIEFLNFHLDFRKFSGSIDADKFIGLLGFENSIDKKLKDFSSGMKQRLKLGLVFWSESKVILLDEPSTNLDQRAFQWYKDELQKLSNRLIIIFSNREEEYQGADEVISLRPN